jgi:hypothetical protein
MVQMSHDGHQSQQAAVNCAYQSTQELATKEHQPPQMCSCPLPAPIRSMQLVCMSTNRQWQLLVGCAEVQWMDPLFDGSGSGVCSLLLCRRRPARQYSGAVRWIKHQTTALRGEEWRILDVITCNGAGKPGGLWLATLFGLSDRTNFRMRT